MKFQIFNNGQPAERWPMRNAYLIGTDGSAMRSDIHFADGLIVVDKREPGTAALALQHPVGEFGELTLQTCLLPERDEAYVLVLELARHRLMILYTKLEDWGLLELDAEHPIARRAERARQKFIEALCLQREDAVAADNLAQECLSIALDGTEELALAHSQLLLNHRKSAGALPAHAIGCGAVPSYAQQRQQAGLATNFDFVQLPMPWKQLAPVEGEYDWSATDHWANWAVRSKLHLVAGPLICFEPNSLPDWLYIWEHDYDTVRDLIYEHVERVVSRYRTVVNQWNVVSGLHVNRHFTFNFEQLMDITRMTTMLVKKLSPGARTVIELCQPFGEYYSNNPRSIPPMMYADLITQSGIHFDGLSIRLLMGQALSGQYTRDLMQISLMLDQFAVFGKPIYLTVAAPSNPVTEAMIEVDDDRKPIDPDSGYWRKPWSQLVQSHWLEAVFQVAMSRPFVESIAWAQMIDHSQIDLPLSGLVTEDAHPKAALRRIVMFRRNLTHNPDQDKEQQPSSIVAGEVEEVEIRKQGEGATPTP